MKVNVWIKWNRECRITTQIHMELHTGEEPYKRKVPMEVRFFGAGGMKASKPKPGLLKQVKMYGADLVVVSLGGNDITTTSVPKDIVAAVLHIAQDFIDSGVSTILVLEIGERGAFRDGLGYRSFASQRARINQLLGKRELVEVLRLPHIRFPAEFMRDKLQVPSDFPKDDYKIVVSGSGGLAFHNKSELLFEENILIIDEVLRVSHNTTTNLEQRGVHVDRDKREYGLYGDTDDGFMTI
ncbi:hypothetical protein MAR_002882 [Mya arenaria]|uniref:SGNH hydrolase-type esterase domain-containing protein n=1 Tax=Mya arenaria TaxID=6604 RepID=A0ABY7G7F1_MYAAR|nr:hypothetical protein MAR_002882 [Mya arenaria]